jgi:hypothetical protein
MLKINKIIYRYMIKRIVLFHENIINEVLLILENNCIPMLKRKA